VLRVNFFFGGQFVRIEDLMGADEEFGSTTAAGVVPCSRVGNIDAGDKMRADGRPWPISVRIKSLYWQKHAEGWHGTPVNCADVEAPLDLVEGMA
jgi:branched-chain amino acid aminotransferase